MEMIVVFPIYLILFAGLFMLGDMLIKAARLPSAERTTAFDLGREAASEEGWNAVRNLLFANSDTDDLHNETSEYYADTAIQGPFSLRAAVKILNDYKMPSGIARGQLQFADWFFARSTPNGAEMATGDGGMGDLLHSENRIRMYSKNNTFEREYTYNYYTLRRRRYKADQWTWRDNRRHASHLLIYRDNNVEHYNDNDKVRVWEAVAEEGFHESVNNDESAAWGPASADMTEAEYSRYPKFIRWSE